MVASKQKWYFFKEFSNMFAPSDVKERKKDKAHVLKMQNKA